MTIDEQTLNKMVTNISKSTNIKPKKQKLLAEMVGMSDVYNFKIKLISDKINNFNFLKVHHKLFGDVLTQVINITRDNKNNTFGICKVIGHRDDGKLVPIRQPFDMYDKIELANDLFIESTIGLNRVDGAFVGTLEYHDKLKISMEFKDLLTKHIAILAKTGVGKSYTLGVILEEIIKKNIPVIIIDPHGEYQSLRFKNDDKLIIDKLNKLGLKPMGFGDKVKLYSPDTVTNSYCEKITLPLEGMSPQDLINSLPQKPSPAQQGLLFNILNNLNDRINFDELIFNISNEDINSKWALISMLETLKKTKLFTQSGTALNDLVKYKQATVINLKGVTPNISDIVVTNLLKNLFDARKKEQIPPFLLVLEEAHNFAPEKGLGKKNSNAIISLIASEGRKFGAGLCLVSQRPAKIDKNVLSQCQTQIIMKLTNTNDLKAVTSSCEGLDKDSGNEISRLNIGSCILTGIIDVPLKVNVRPRFTKHGGETIGMEEIE